MNRRRFLQTTSITGTSPLIGVSGCIGSLSDGNELPNGERAGYDSWVGSNAVEDGTIGTLTISTEVYQSLQNEETDTSTPTSTTDADTETDPLVGIPATYLVGALFGLGFGLSGAGVSGLIEEDGLAERAHLLTPGIVLEGSFDTDSVSSSVSNAGGESVDSYQDYTLFRQASGGTETAVAVSGDAIVVVNGSDGTSNPAARLRKLLAVDAGEASRYRNESVDYDSLVTALPARGVMGISFDSNGGVLDSDDGSSAAGDSSSTGLVGFGDLPLDGDAVGGATSASISSNKVTSAVVILYASKEDVDTRADIEAALGSQANSRSVSIDGRTVYVEGTYEELEATE